MKGPAGRRGATQRDAKSERSTRSAETAMAAQPTVDAALNPLDAVVQALGNRRLSGLLASDRTRPDAHEAASERFASDVARPGAIESAMSAPSLGPMAAAADTRVAPTVPPMRVPTVRSASNADLSASRASAGTTADATAASILLPTPPRAQRLSNWLGEGRALAPGTASALAARLGVDVGAVRVHDSPQANRLASALRAAAFTVGRDIVFGAGQYAPATSRGRRLLAHELQHVAQQTLRRVAGHALAPLATLLDPSGRTALQRAPAPDADIDDDAGVADPAPADDVYDIPPDDATLEAGVDQDYRSINERWWRDLELDEVWPFRQYDPTTQPQAYANRVVRAQRIFREAGTKWFEGGHLKADGILGPRTFLMLRRVAEDETHPLRLQIQGLGFDLDAILFAEDAYLHALAYARKAEILLQTPIEVYGESAVRFYDTQYSMVAHDRETFDRLMFDGAAPSDMRREDRIELLKRFYGSDGAKYKGTIALMEAKRDFLHSELDVQRALENDRRRGIARAAYFKFSATSARMLALMDSEFDVGKTLQKAFETVPEDKKQHIVDGVDRLAKNQTEGPELGAKEISAVVLLVYLPPLDPAVRDAAIAKYVQERDAKRAEEKARIEENNREGARQRADIIVKWLDDEDTYRLTVEFALREELQRAVREQAFFDLVLDDLARRSGGYFDKLFDAVHAMRGYVGLSLLVEAARAGRYRDHPRVRTAQEELIRRHGGKRTHRYEINANGGTVFLDRDTRMQVGEVAGDLDSKFLKDEDREQLRPEARKKLEAELESQSRQYIARLLEGTETPKTQEEVGKLLLEKAWAAAGLDTDRDIEDVEWQESVRLLGVREGQEEGDGVTRYEVKYERVERILGGEAGDTAWTPVEGARNDWRSEYTFEYDTFWYPYSQNADVMEGFAKVVLVGAVIAVAWEAGVIGALVTAGGGAVPVALSIGISMAIYMLTHKRWTLEGLLMAGVEGYLAAVGFRLFAPAGKVAARLVLPATLEKVAFGRLVAAWLLKHGTVGALAGGAMGPSVLFMHDMIRVMQHGGSLSSFSEYLKSAGMGMVLGAVFEIGGSALLAPIFRAADTTVLAKMSDILTALRGHQPAITPTQWMSEVTLSLSAFRKFLGHQMDEILAKGIYDGVKEKMAEAGRAWLTGVRGTLQQQIIDLAGVQLTRDASNGLERLLTLGRTTLGDDTLATMLQTFRKARPDGIEPWLRFIGGVDDAMAKNLVTTTQLRPLFDAEQVLALGLRRTPGELMNLMTLRFGNALDALETFAKRANALDNAVSDSVLDALRTRGTAVTPRSLLRAAETGHAIDDELLDGLARVLDGSDAGAVDAVLEKMANDRVGSFLRELHGSDQAGVDAAKAVIASVPTDLAAWSLMLSGPEAQALLGKLSGPARAAITDVSARQAQSMVASLGDKMVNDALSQGAATGTMRGSHLQSLRDHWSDAATKDFLKWAGTTPGSLKKVADFATALGSAGGRLPTRAPLTSSSVILDSNALISVDKLLKGTPYTSVTDSSGAIVTQGLMPNEQAAIEAIRKARGLGAYTPPTGRAPTIDDIVGGGFDLRANITTTAEAVIGEAAKGPSKALDAVGSAGKPTYDAGYEAIIDDLGKKGVGKPKGARDRTVVADALTSPRASAADIPTLVVVDDDILIRLAKNYATPTKFVPKAGGVSEKAQLATTFPSGSFTVDVLGHKLHIAFK